MYRKNYLIKRSNRITRRFPHRVRLRHTAWDYRPFRKNRGRKATSELRPQRGARVRRARVEMRVMEGMVMETAERGKFISSPRELSVDHLLRITSKSTRRSAPCLAG